MKNKDWNRTYMREYNKTEAQHERNRRFMKEYSKRPEVRERSRRWHQTAERKEIKKKIDRTYYLANRERLKAKSQEWKRNHPNHATRYHHAFREGRARRRARLYDAQGSHTEAQWLMKAAYYGGRCFYCKIIPKLLTKDHAISLSRGGTDWVSNLLPACASCNSRKHTMTWYEYMETL